MSMVEADLTEADLKALESKAAGYVERVEEIHKELFHILEKVDSTCVLCKSVHVPEEQKLTCYCTGELVWLNGKFTHDEVQIRVPICWHCLEELGRKRAEVEDAKKRLAEKRISDDKADKEIGARLFNVMAWIVLGCVPLAFFVPWPICLGLAIATIIIVGKVHELRVNAIRCRGYIEIPYQDESLRKDDLVVNHSAVQYLMTKGYRCSLTDPKRIRY